MSNYTNNWIAGSGGSGISLQAASQNTITLGSIGAQGSGYATGIFNFDEFSHRPDIKKYEVYEIGNENGWESHQESVSLNSSYPTDYDYD